MAILVIDDEGGLRRSVCAYLEDLDYDTLDAANGRDGLEILHRRAKDIEAVIVDLNMTASLLRATLARPGRRSWTILASTPAKSPARKPLLVRPGPVQ